MLNNFSLTFKSLVSFGLLAIIGIGVGLVGYFQSHAASDAVAQLQKLEHQVSAIKELEVELVDQANSLQSYLLTGDRKWADHVTSDVARIEDHFDPLSTVDGIRAVKSAWQDWYSNFARKQMTLMQSQQGGDRALAIESTRKSNDALHALIDQMNVTADTLHARMLELTKRENATLASVTTSSLIGLIALAVATIMLALLNHTIVSRPLGLLAKVTETLAKGDLGGSDQRERPGR